MSAEDPAPAPLARRGRAWLALLLAAALGLRVLAVADYEARHPHADAPVIDEASYDAWAREIAAGDWIGDEVFFQEPLYPYALGVVYAATDGSRLAARLVQAALGVVAVGLVFLLGRRALGPPAGWIAGGLLALHPVAVLMPCLLLKPNLFVPLLAALALLLVRADADRPRRWLAVGALAGAGALLRGNLLVLLPVLALWPLLHARPARAWRGSAAFVGGALLVLAPVAARNLAVGGVLALTTSGAGTNLYGGNSLENPYGVATELPWVRGVPEHEATDWRLEAERRTGRELDAGETSRFWTAELLASVRADPAAHARVLWNKLRLTLGAYEVPDNHALAWDARYVRVLAPPIVGWGLFAPLGLAGVALWLGLRRAEPAGRRRAGDDLALLFALYLGTIVLTVTSMRARLPLVVPLLPFAGWFVGAAASAGRARRAGAVAASAVLLALAALVVHLPVLSAEQRARDLAERDHNLAVELLARGEVERAADLAGRLAREHPRSARLVVLDAAVRAELVFDALAAGAPADDAREAELAELLRTLRAVFEDDDVGPRERARAAGVAARVQEGLGQTARAERQLRRARAFAAADADLLATHARLLVELLAEPGADPEERAELEAVARDVLADLERLGDPEGVGPALDAALRR